MTKLGLVTILYNSDDVLDDFFKSLSKQSFKNYHLFIVDNSPSQATTDLIAKLTIRYPLTAFSYVKNDSNLGVATGNNQGIEMAIQQGADYVCLLNNDIDFTDTELLQNMVDYAVQSRENIIVPKILYHNTRQIWLAGGKFLHYKGISVQLGDLEPDGIKFNQAAYTGYAPTCFILISRKVFETIGLMDEQYFVYYDDNDFVLRAIRAGFKIWYMPSLEVFHKVSISTGGDSSLFSIFYLNRNRVYFIRKLYRFPLKQIALAEAILGQAIRYIQLDKAKKKVMLNAFRTGFRISVPSTEKYL